MTRKARFVSRVIQMGERDWIQVPKENKDMINPLKGKRITVTIEEI